MRNDVIQKAVALSIVVLCLSIIPTISSASVTQSFFRSKQDSNQNENFTIKITSPENGVYWNTHKIFPFRTPLILHGLLEIEFEIQPEINVYKIYCYVNGQFASFEDNPPFYPFKLTGKPFSHIQITLIAYSDKGQASDEITCVRLFP